MDKDAGRDIRIYVFHYKDGHNLSNSSIHEPIMAGNALTVNTSGFLGDDTHDSISHKNLYFSELTGIYWVWKNTRHEVTGSCHYRRFFTAKAEPTDYLTKRLYQFLRNQYKARYSFIKTSQISRFSQRIISYDEIEKILANFDAILPKPRKFKTSVEQHYAANHNPADLVLLKSILSEKYPAYTATFNTMLAGNRLYANNMFVLKRSDFERFMPWWFDILFAFEKRCDLTQYRGDQQRIIGFIAERMLTLWFLHQQLKVKELKIIFFKHLKYA